LDDDACAFEEYMCARGHFNLLLNFFFFFSILGWFGLAGASNAWLPGCLAAGNIWDIWEVDGWARGLGLGCV
jgi:hypothetical protein